MALFDGEKDTRCSIGLIVSFDAALEAHLVRGPPGVGWIAVFADGCESVADWFLPAPPRVEEGSARDRHQLPCSRSPASPFRV
jgi:hypothetical protein